jgi:hypothetical protein
MTIGIVLCGGKMLPLNESFINYRQLNWLDKASSGEEEKWTEEWQELHVTS